MRILLRAGNRWYPYDITDDGYIGTWTIENPTAFQDKFPTKPSTLHSFLTFLENQNQVSISFANYKVERQNVTIDGMESWKCNMTAEQDCVFSITQKFGKAKNSAKPTRDNIGALLDHAKIKASSVVKPIIKLLCPMHVGKKHAKERVHTQSQGGGGGVCAWGATSVVFYWQRLRRYDEKERLVKPGLWSLFASKPIRVAKGNLLQLL